MKPNLFSNKQSGISLVLSILILSLILGIVLGISTILFQEITMARGVGNSVVALYAADSGIEEILLVRDNPSSSCTQSSPCQLGNGATYYMSITPAGQNCSSQNYCIKSIGIYKGIRRGIEIDY